MRQFALICLLFMISFNSFAEDQSVSGEWVWNPDKLSQHTEPPLWNALRQSPLKPLVAIDEIRISAPIKLESIRNWNTSGYSPLKNGINHKMSSKTHVVFLKVRGGIPLHSPKYLVLGKYQKPPGLIKITFKRFALL